MMQYTGPDPTPRDCREAYLNGCRKDGVYTIDPGCGKPFNVFCDMKNGGWTVFQRRRDGSEDFYRNWADYVAGFGQLKGALTWLGETRLSHYQKTENRTKSPFGRLRRELQICSIFLLLCWQQWNKLQTKHSRIYRNCWRSTSLS